MLSKEDLIYLGAMLLLVNHDYITETDEEHAIENAYKMFDKVFERKKDNMILD